MSKKYTIAYTHIGGERDKTTTDPEKLLLWLEEALTNPHVSVGTIKINTEEKK